MNDAAFDAFFSAAMAWNQVGLIAGGLVMLLIGGFLIACFFHTRRKGRKIAARLGGVRATGIKEAANDVAPPQAETEPERSWEEFGKEFRKSPRAGLAALFFALMIVGIPL